MNKKKICFIAQFPPPIHGLSKAVDTLYKSDLNVDVAEKGRYVFQKVNITNNCKLLNNIKKIIKSDADLYYITISQSQIGNLRDLLILNLLVKRKKRIIVHLHGGYYRTLVDFDVPKWQRKENYKAISKVNGVIVLGNSLKWIFKGMIDEEKIHVVPNCIDDEYLISDYDFENKIKAIKKEKIHHVLWLSNFIESKGYPFVLQMAKFEKDRVNLGGNKRYHFDFAGQFFNKKDEAAFFDFIRQNKLENYISYYGIVTGQEKISLLKKCIFFALPTRYPKEGQPISILEAMGNGMSIITTEYAGIPDIVKNNENGLLLSKEEVTNVMAKNILSKLDDINIEIQLRKNREVIREYFNQNRYLENMDDCFVDVLSEKM